MISKAPTVYSALELEMPRAKDHTRSRAIDKNQSLPVIDLCTWFLLFPCALVKIL